MQIVPSNTEAPCWFQNTRIRTQNIYFAPSPTFLIYVQFVTVIPNSCTHFQKKKVLRIVQTLCYQITCACNKVLEYISLNMSRHHPVFSSIYYIFHQLILNVVVLYILLPKSLPEDTPTRLWIHYLFQSVCIFAINMRAIYEGRGKVQLLSFC